MNYLKQPHENQPWYYFNESLVSVLAHWFSLIFFRTVLLLKMYLKPMRQNTVTKLVINFRKGIHYA